MKKFSLLFVMLLTLGMVLTSGCHKNTAAQPQAGQAVTQPEQAATPETGMQATPEAGAEAQPTTETAQ